MRNTWEERCIRITSAALATITTATDKTNSEECVEKTTFWWYSSYLVKNSAKRGFPTMPYSWFVCVGSAKIVLFELLRGINGFIPSDRCLCLWFSTPGNQCCLYVKMLVVFRTGVTGVNWCSVLSLVTGVPGVLLRGLCKSRSEEWVETLMHDNSDVLVSVPWQRCTIRCVSVCVCVWPVSVAI